MRQRGFSPRTHESYLGAVTELARYYRRSPDTLTVAELQGFFNHWVQVRGLAPASCRLYLNAIRFLYLKVLQWERFDVPVVLPKRPQQIPELLTRDEVNRILGACSNAKHRLLLEVCYGCGLRVSERVALRIRDIDDERGLLRIEQGKGGKDRNVILAPCLRDKLSHLKSLQTSQWLFPSDRGGGRHLSVATAQKLYGRAKARVGVERVGGIHGLRHAYASHQLEGGMPLPQLQQQLGHNHLRTTGRYIHWLADHPRARDTHTDLVAALEKADE